MDALRSSWLRLALLISLLIAPGCSGEGSAATDTQDTALADASSDASSDAADASQADAARDVAADVEPDVEADAAPAPITLGIDFSGGSLDLANSSVDGESVTLAGREGYYDGEWKWFYFRVDNAADKTPAFTIPTNFAGGADALADHKVVYSTDGASWDFFDNNTLDADAGEFRFSNDQAFTTESAVVAFGIPYTVDDAASLVSDLKQSRWAFPTPSADDQFVLGQSPGGTDDLGRTIDPQPIYGFLITDAGASGAKAKIVLTGGVHANEPTGNHVLEGVVRWLVSDDAEAAELRKAAAFYVYPMVNPDGYEAGLDRATVAQPGTDANRVFAEGQWADHAEVKLVGEAMQADTGGRVDYLLDFHVAFGSGDVYAYTDADGDPTGLEMRHDPFWTALGGLESITARDASLGYDTAMRFGWQALDAEFVATFEPYYQPDWDLARYHAFGASIGEAFAQARDSFGGVEFDMDFDSGSLDVANTSITGDTVTLAGRDNYNPGKWKWIYFRARNVLGRKLEFRIGDNFASGSGRLTDHKFVYSYDRQTWRFFDNGGLQSSQYRFSNDDAFSQNVVYIAYGVPYPFEKAVDLVATAKQSQWVSPTTSADNNLIIGQSAGGTDDLGRAIPPHDLYGFQITDTSASGPKEKIVLLSGVHSNEVNGNHTLHGLVEWLLGTSAEAAQLRRDAIIYVYPMVNPDGRYAGYNRGTVEAEREDPNRQWSSGNWGNNTEVRIVAQALSADTGGDIDYLMDLHSKVGTGQHFAYLDADSSPTGADMRQSTFWQQLTNREPLWAKDASFIGRTTMRYGWAVLNAEFSSVQETYFRPGENVGRYHQLGRSIGLSFYDAVSQ